MPQEASSCEKSRARHAVVGAAVQIAPDTSYIAISYWIFDNSFQSRPKQLRFMMSKSYAGKKQDPFTCPLECAHHDL